MIKKAREPRSPRYHEVFGLFRYIRDASNLENLDENG
jgi:hypothetical protein